MRRGSTGEIKAETGDAFLHRHLTHQTAVLQYGGEGRDAVKDVG